MAFPKGTSGNPGGQPKLAKAWQAAAGKTRAEITAEALKVVYERMLEGPSGESGKGDPDWRFAVQKVLEYSAGKPKEEIEITDKRTQATLDTDSMTDQEIVDALDAIGTLKRLGAVPDDDAPTEH